MNDVNLIKLVLDPTTMQIMRLAVFEDLYPSQIASMLGKSKGFVSKKLNALEKHGVIKGRFETKKRAVIKKFELIDEEISLKVNLKDGGVDLKKKEIERKETKPTEKVKELFR